VLEAVIDPEDIMSAPGAGRVGRHHFERLLSARLESSREEVTMKAGVDALYTRHDPEDAAAQFRKLLGWNPNHYGATFQLARALDQGSKRGEARPWWEKALKMAEASHDTATAAAARARLAEQP
jgi:tetratricopeptide (TPR) repeat protein